MIAFASALFILLITPGPGVLTTADVAAGFGFRAGLPYLTGVVSGALFVMIAVSTMLFSGFPFYPQNTLLENSTKLAIFLTIAVPIHLLWLGLGGRPETIGAAPSDGAPCQNCHGFGDVGRGGARSFVLECSALPAWQRQQSGTCQTQSQRSSIMDQGRQG